MLSRAHLSPSSIISIDSGEFEPFDMAHPRPEHQVGLFDTEIRQVKAPDFGGTGINIYCVIEFGISINVPVHVNTDDGIRAAYPGDAAGQDINRASMTSNISPSLTGGMKPGTAQLAKTARLSEPFESTTSIPFTRSVATDRKGIFVFSN